MVKFGETELINFYKRHLIAQQIATIEKIQATSTVYSAFLKKRNEPLESNLFYVAGRTAEELDVLVEKIIQGEEVSASSGDLSLFASVTPVSSFSFSLLWKASLKFQTQKKIFF